MVPEQSIIDLSVIWRDKKLLVKLNSEASLKELGEELQHLTGVRADTIKLIIPQSSTKSSKLFVPFSDDHSCLKLEHVGILEGRPLRMMGTLGNEVDQLLKYEKSNLRIAGFEDEEKRMKQRLARGPQLSLKLPEGPYTFGDFRTLELPGIKLTPPPSEALKRMHMLAADPGIVAIMKKHRWRVGIMTEMAPEGRVGISPVCLLGLNKNHGEEISLRLRTDDLKGFRKYETIKRTLLHELAHMVYSEHDSNFYALDRQLNQEAFSLDWTRSKGHTLSDVRFSELNDMDEDFESEGIVPHKLGGNTSHISTPARAASVSAAYVRWAESSTIHQEPDPDDSEARGNMNLELDSEVIEGIALAESSCNDTEMTEVVTNFTARGRFDGGDLRVEPDPDDLEASENGDLREEPDPDDLEASENRIVDDSQTMHTKTKTTTTRISEEPDPDDCEARDNATKFIVSDALNGSRMDQSQLKKVHLEPDPDVPQENRTGLAQSNPNDNSENPPQILGDMTEEPDPDDNELKRIQDPASAFCDRLTKGIEKLRSDLSLKEANTVLQTLFRMIRKIIENPNERKYKRLRKANPLFQRSIVVYKAAMELVYLIGFGEDIVTDEIGKSETYVVLKRDDPAMLWLANSIIERQMI